jgi:hypothetical protein
VHSGRQTHDQKTRIQRAKGWHGSTKVVWIPLVDVIEKRRKPWAFSAIFVVEFIHHPCGE